jgi:hypothetical protein
MVVVVMAKLDAKVEDVYRAEFNANENSRLIAVSIAVFVVVFVYKDFIPAFLFGWIIGQLVIALPLLYKSSDAYEKTAYREDSRWKWFGKILGRTAAALEFNAIALLVYTVSFEFALFFIIITFSLESIYAGLDVLERRRNLKKRLFKSALLICLQLIFGLGILLYARYILLI